MGNVNVVNVANFWLKSLYPLQGYNKLPLSYFEILTQQYPHEKILESPCSTIQRLLSTQSLQNVHHWALNERTICMELSA